jgi:hypothetical protein
MFGHGYGNGIICALGPADQMGATVDAREVARFLGNTYQWSGPQVAREQLKDILDERRSRRFRSAFYGSAFPYSGFSSREAFEAWRTRSAEAFDSVLEDEAQ